MDCTEMISALEGYFEGKDLKRGDALRIADAMKTLLAEREVLISELHKVKNCTSCKFYFGDVACFRCNAFLSKWQWCGI